MRNIDEQTETMQKHFLFSCGFKCHLPDNPALVIFWLCGHSWAAPLSKSLSLLQRSKEPLPCVAIRRTREHFFVFVVYFLLKLASRLCSCLIYGWMNDIFIVRMSRQCASCPLTHTPHINQEANILIRIFKLTLFCSRKNALQYNFLLNTVHCIQCAICL